ncbi:Branched-chain-amino-acid aminotransferase-like protein 2 [Abeliophyllum distichum]|uniref:Branched-chain-amino-acid aminotransferase-like protein 2 n=1 Tax=Abeliophyllum distichum TaxID=126358 RepID=A0ABD1RTV4_9LAMI
MGLICTPCWTFIYHLNVERRESLQPFERNVAKEKEGKSMESYLAKVVHFGINHIFQYHLWVTSGMNPSLNLYGCTLIVLAEWKPPVYDNTRGITLVTATTRRNSPNNLDSKIHHNNLLNNILAKIEGNNAQADDAIMLDKDGYVSETNATNIFLVKKGRILTPHADNCLPGITRATVMDLATKENLVVDERRISLSEFHTADEVWTTGTMGELNPVIRVDGRIVGDGRVGPMTQRLQKAYKKFTAVSGVPIPTLQQSREN